jgi:hypothetical protein
LAESTAPRAVVGGHKKPEASDEAVEMLSGTRDYIPDFADAAENAVDSEELEKMMLAKYEWLGNPRTLRLSAHAWFSR